MCAVAAVNDVDDVSVRTDLRGVAAGRAKAILQV